MRPLFNELRDWYEVAVIGGGINGAGIAAALAQAGYSVLLLEKGDFGSGTTSKSTRLIHGGLRYLEHADLGLVRESLRERKELLRRYPHLIKPLRLLMPIYAGGHYPAWKVRAGLTLYDLLARGGGLPGHKSLGAQATLRAEPNLSATGLRSAFTFSDCQAELPERLTVETVLEARRLGANCLNYIEARGLARIESKGATSFRLSARDLLSDEDIEVSADVVINAAGPWVDQLLGVAGGGGHRRIGGTRGSHLVLRPEILQLKQAIYAPARSDGRPFFLIPWLGQTLLGTTDVRVDGSPDQSAMSSGEVAYLLDEANLLLKIRLTHSDVIYTYSGVRALPYHPGGSESAITRRHFFVDHASEGLGGLYSLVGGKLTTYRSVGRKAADLVRRRLGQRWPVKPDICEAGPTPAGFEQVWGNRAGEVFARYEDRLDLREPICEHTLEPKAAVVEAARNELATCLADVFLRRTRVGWMACQGLLVAHEAAQMLGAELNWPKERVAAEVQRYREELATVHPPLYRVLEQEEIELASAASSGG
ncbi:MAG: glycerol-3-phosphate dehydrogenase/oxidase [Dehalococcoidia bacterium]